MNHKKSQSLDTSAGASRVERPGLLVFTGMGAFLSGVAGLYRRYRRKAAACDHETALRESQARLAVFAAATFEGIVESDAGRIVDCNEQLARMLGYTVAQLTGMPIASLVAPEDRDRVVENIQQGGESVIEHGVLRKDGSRIVAEAHGQPAFPGSARRLTAVRDVTDRNRADAVLQTTLRRFYDVFSNMSSAVLLLTEDGRVEFANQAFCDGFGLAGTPADLLGLTAHDIIEKIKHAYPNPDEAIARILEIVDRGQPVRGEEVPMQGGRTCLRDFVLLRVQGKPCGRLWLHYDITKRKQAEEALRESREQLDLALVSSRMATFDWDIVKDKRTWSEGVHDLLGTKPESFTGTAEEFFRVIHPADRGCVQAALARAVEITGEYETEYRAIWPDGSIRHLSARGKINRDSTGRAVRLAGVCWDINERKRAEEALRQKETELQRAQRVAHIGSWHWDAKTDAIIGSDELLRIHGFDPATQSMPDFRAQRGKWYPVEDWERVNAAVQKTVQTGVGYELDVRVIQGGAPRWVTTRGEAVRDAAGAILGLRGTVQDITARKQAEEALRASNEELTRFNEAMVGRELRMIELKKEINALCAKVGQPPRY